MVFKNIAILSFWKGIITKLRCYWYSVTSFLLLVQTKFQMPVISSVYFHSVRCQSSVVFTVYFQSVITSVYCLLSVSQMPAISNGATFNGFLLNAQQVGSKQNKSC